MTPTTNAKSIRKHKPRQKKRHRKRARDDKVRPTSSPQPLGEVINEKKRKPKKKKASSVPIPVSDDPLEKVCIVPDLFKFIYSHEQNIPENIPMPAGYVLVPKGDVYVTRHCRSKTKDIDQIVYVVYVSFPSTKNREPESNLAEPHGKTHPGHSCPGRHPYLRA